LRWQSLIIDSLHASVRCHVLDRRRRFWHATLRLRSAIRQHRGSDGS